ncbi:hypothetical protein H0H93_010620 [Arthromyces matolae]|nr:hypothetical protein H0H93_010620 [Arthromyces matolae]
MPLKHVEENATVQIRCAQAYGSEIYVGCSNGELVRFALQADDPNKLESYNILSRQIVPNEKPVDDIVLVPCLGRAFILSDRILHFYTLPSLDPVSPSIVKPIRHVVTFTVDHRDLQRPPISLSSTSMALEAEIPLPQGATLSRRLGRSLCIADKEFYSMVDLEGASLLPVIPISQAPDPDVTIKPSITIVGENEFLILSWTGANTIGLFITGEGEPVRGTLEWGSHPESLCLDYPYITALLPNGSIEIHSIETQSVVQVIAADDTPTNPQNPQQQSRATLVSILNGYLVPSTQRSEKMRTTRVQLLRAPPTEQPA